MKKNILPCILLCAAVLTSCARSEEVAETSAATFSESVSETTKTETRTETVDETEAPEISETVPMETESTENFDKVKDRIIFDDGENTLTAGQYIEALLEYGEFIGRFDFFYNFQIMDIDENGIPEIMIYYSNFMSYTGSRIYTVTNEGKAKAVPILNHNLCDSSDHGECYDLIGEKPIPYEKDGKTIWISNFSGAGTGGGYGGEYILQYDGSGIDGEVIDRAEYVTYGQNDENGEWYWVREDYYYIFGEEVTEEEFDRRKQEFFESLQPSDALYVQYTMGEKSEITENIAEALEKYIDMREEADKSA